VSHAAGTVQIFRDLPDRHYVHSSADGTLAFRETTIAIGERWPEEEADGAQAARRLRLKAGGEAE
jgi:hypothetical protein